MPHGAPPIQKANTHIYGARRTRVLMRQANEFSMACVEISRNLLAAGGSDRRAVRSEIMKVCTKYSLGRIPRNNEILASVSGSDFARLQGVLLRKPVKTASGVAVIALMPEPYACPHGRCTYCPGGAGANTPNSYTGSEPPAISAIENNYDPKKQILSKLSKLLAYGHDASKIELIVIGGTFLFMPKTYQESFIKSCYDALNGFDSPTLAAAKTANPSSEYRCVGFTIETKPDYCKEEHVDAMLRFGITRVEIGVQCLRESVYRITNRGHSYGDVVESFRISRDAGYKIAAHMMPGLPTMTPEKDIEDFGRLFGDPSLRPDMLKIYPSLVLEGTPLLEEYRRGRYCPYTDSEMLRVLAEAKRRVPKWVRIMRVQREIPSSEIIAGPRQGNLRQVVLDRLEREGTPCRCIRCREAGLSGKAGAGGLRLDRIDYQASGGQEVFLSFIDGDDSVYGFLRLRRPGAGAHRPEITPGSCIVRELHVYGRSLKLGDRREDGIQHSGLGRMLMERAQEIAGGELGADRLLVISAVGTRQYYGKLGYTPDGPYMSKRL